MAKVAVAVVFGGRSAEHEVSILTAHEAIAVLAAMPAYDVVPIYITKDGRWLTGEALNDLDKFADPAKLERDCMPLVLRPMSPQPFTAEKTGLFGKAEPVKVDVALPVIHGPNGEDGTLQGTFEMLGVPYAGSGVLASALCMDKVAMKRMFASAGLPQVPYAVIDRDRWSADATSETAAVEALGGGPVFVKPARGGSSIGVTFVQSAEELAPAVELALTFDDEAVVEVAVTGGDEVNCAVLRTGNEVTASTLEMVHAKDGFLTFEQKYMEWSKGAPAKGPGKGGLQGHTVPAPLPAEVTGRIQSLAKEAFEVCMCDGVARVDFLVRGEEVYVNEINTLPGSLAFYLWEASGVPFDELLDRMVKSATARAAARGSLLFSLDRNLLAEIEAAKGSKRV